MCDEGVMIMFKKCFNVKIRTLDRVQRGEMPFEWCFTPNPLGNVNEQQKPVWHLTQGLCDIESKRTMEYKLRGADFLPFGEVSVGAGTRGPHQCLLGWCSSLIQSRGTHGVSAAGRRARCPRGTESVGEAARGKLLVRKTLYTGENWSGFPLQADAAWGQSVFYIHTQPSEPRSKHILQLGKERHKKHLAFYLLKRSARTTSWFQAAVLTATCL